MARSNSSSRQSKTPSKPPRGKGGDEHGVKDIRQALNALDEQGGWGDTEEKSFGEVPDGKYQVKIEVATINNSKSSGRLQVSWEFTIEAPYEFKGRKLWAHDGIDDEDGRAWFRGKLARIGLEWPKKASDLPDTLEEAIGTYAEVSVKTKDQYQNVYLNKALDSDDVDTSIEAPDDGADDQPASPPPPPASTGKRGGRAAAPPPPPPATEASATFTDDDLMPVHRKSIKTIAKANDFEPDDYNAMTDLMLDVAEKFQIFGEFSDPAVLMAEIEKANEAA